jgi:putative membrane protein
MWGWGGLGGWGHAAYGFPFWWLAAGFRLVVIAAIIVGIVFVARYFVRQGGGRFHEESALDILQKRYARGEITKEQYEEMKRNLS